MIINLHKKTLIYLKSLSKKSLIYELRVYKNLIFKNIISARSPIFNNFTSTIERKSAFEWANYNNKYNDN